MRLYSREWLRGYPRVSLGWLKDLIWHTTYIERESRDGNGLGGEQRDCQEEALPISDFFWTLTYILLVGNCEIVKCERDGVLELAMNYLSHVLLIIGLSNSQ